MLATSEIQEQSQDEVLRKEQEQRLDKLNVFLGEHPDVEEGWAPSVDILAINEAGKLVIKNGKGEEVRAFGLSLGKDKLKLVRSIYEGTGLEFPEKDSKLATTEATKLYLQARERRSVETNPLEDVVEEETPEDENNKEPIWYEGIVDDLKSATDPKVKYDKRLPARETLKSHGIDIDRFINQSPDGGDVRMMMIRDAAYALGGSYNPKHNRWGDPQVAIDYLRENFGISQPEDEGNDEAAKKDGPKKLVVEQHQEKTDVTVPEGDTAILDQLKEMISVLPPEEREKMEKVLTAAVVLMSNTELRETYKVAWETRYKPLLEKMRVKMI